MTIRFETDGPIALLTIDRPKVHNALDFETSDALVAAWEQHDYDIRHNTDYKKITEEND